MLGGQEEEARQLGKGKGVETRVSGQEEVSAPAHGAAKDPVLVQDGGVLLWGVSPRQDLAEKREGGVSECAGQSDRGKGRWRWTLDTSGDSKRAGRGDKKSREPSRLVRMVCEEK